MPSSVTTRCADLALGDGSSLFDELDAVALELAVDVLELAGIELALGERLRDLDGAQRSALGTRVDQALELGERFKVSGKNHGVRLLLATADPCMGAGTATSLLPAKKCGSPKLLDSATMYNARPLRGIPEGVSGVTSFRQDTPLDRLSTAPSGDIACISPGKHVPAHRKASR